MQSEEKCCPGTEGFTVTRFILGDLSAKKKSDYLRSHGAKSQELVDYKAFSRINGNLRRRDKTADTQSIKIKANTLRQIGSSILSSIVPGDLGPLRSPARSAAYRSITPGFGGGRRGGSLPGQNRAHRCPEGYQYGGRFTDNRLSTCGARLFDIPSIIGSTLRAIRRAQTSGLPSDPSGRVITGGRVDSSLIINRAPQIPRVGNENRGSTQRNVSDLTEQIGKFNRSSNQKIRRMVRRDGFVLEPVVPNKVLRAIPDNRDMEGAYFLMSALSPKDIGGEELGLLSNTGIRGLTYVLPGGSTLKLEKARKLTVGERRKLGRVVNTAQELNNTRDPAARLRNVAQEIGSGLSYEENFIGIKNPNQIVGSTTAWANKLFKNRKLEKPEPEDRVSSTRETVSLAAKGKLISSLDAAINHVADGGSMARIEPKILAKLLSAQGVLQKEKLSDSISLVASGNQKFFLYEKPKKYQHIAERFASDVQQHLGLESPDIIFAEGPKDKRKYLREDVESAIPGSRFSPDIKFEDLEIADVARMMVADMLTDQRERPKTSIYPMQTADGYRAVLAENTTSGLIDLSKIEITKRMKMNIADFYTNRLTPSYSDYYQKLRAEQRILFIKLISQMINRAKSFSTAKFRSDMDGYGLSEGEKIHLNIVTKLFSARLDVLMKQKNVIREMMSGAGK